METKMRKVHRTSVQRDYSKPSQTFPQLVAEGGTPFISVSYKLSYEYQKVPTRKTSKTSVDGYLISFACHALECTCQELQQTFREQAIDIRKQTDKSIISAMFHSSVLQRALGNLIELVPFTPTPIENCGGVEDLLHLMLRDEYKGGILINEVLHHALTTSIAKGLYSHQQLLDVMKEALAEYPLNNCDFPDLFRLNLMWDMLEIEQELKAKAA